MKRASNLSEPRLSRLALAALLVAGMAAGAAQGQDDLPDTITLDTVIRDFLPKGAEGGHPDFQAFTGTTTIGLAAAELGDHNVPVAASLRGQTINAEFKDSQGRHINPALFDPSLGDTAGTLSNGGTNNGLTSAESFAQWYKDVPGVNASKSISLVLKRAPGTNRYVFDSATDEPFRSIGGFFPINGQLYGDFGSTGHNFHFTTEVRTQFIYNRGSGQAFTFTGDDDVWVYINGRLVIDLGGLHSKKVQFIDLDRLDWLEDGAQCTLDIFHAERRTTQSNFRIETTIALRSIELPPTAALFD
jgi:fibro-slime domain-containing protein